MSKDAINVVTMPKWGLAMQEGTVTAWHIEAGASIAVGEPLCDIETAKITNEFETPFGGTVARILKPDGSLVRVGEAIAVIVSGEADEAEIDEVLAGYASETSSREADGTRVSIVDTALGPIAMLQAGDQAAERAVLFIHGFGGDHANWELLQGELPQDIRSISIDLPGHGSSGNQVGNGSVRDIAKAVTAFVDAQGLKCIDLIGHSLGGLIAGAVAATRPDLVRSLVVISPPALGGRANPEFLKGYMAAQRKKDMKPVLEMLFSNPALLSREAVTNAIAHLRSDDARHSLQLICDKLVAMPASKRDEDISFLRRWPTHIFWGNEDQIVPMPPDLQNAAGDILTVFEHVGHMPQVERPSEIATVIAALHRAR